MTVCEETRQELPEQPKQTEHVLQNSHMEYDNNRTQGTSQARREQRLQEKKCMNYQEETITEFSTENPYTKELSLGINLDDEKTEQPNTKIEANGSSPNNEEMEQPRTETEMNNSTKSTQFILSEETIQKKAALNTQEIWQENGLHDPMASLYNNMPMVTMLTNTKQEDSDGFK
ncbi:2275_t:CDS:2, partial [Cetraspora pellucida]